MDGTGWFLVWESNKRNIFSVRERQSVRNIVMWHDCVQRAGFIDMKYRVSTLESLLIKRPLSLTLRVKNKKPRTGAWCTKEQIGMWLLPKLYGGGLSFGPAWWYADGSSYGPMAWFLLSNARLLLKILEIAVFLLTFKISAFQTLIRKLLQKLVMNIIRTSWLKKWQEKCSETFYFRRELFVFCARGTMELDRLVHFNRVARALPLFCRALSQILSYNACTRNRDTLSLCLRAPSQTLSYSACARNRNTFSLVVMVNNKILREKTKEQWCVFSLENLQARNTF